MKRLLPYSILLVVGLLLIIFESDYLYRVQEQNLFLHTSMFFQQRMVVSGGLLTWAGACLTQLFHYSALGIAVLCLLWALLMLLLKQAFRISCRWRWITLLPIACLLLTVTDLGYWIYYLKLPGHLFDATLGMLLAVSLAWAYRSLPAKYGIRSLFIVLSTCASYPLFGFYGLWATILMALLSWRTDGWRIADTLLAAAVVVLVPLACYHWCFHQTNLVNIYWTAFPVFCHVGERFFAYNLPYIALFASTAVMALCLQPGGDSIAPQHQHAVPVTRPNRLQAAILVAAAVCVAVFWYKDGNFHRELSMLRAMEQQDWQRVVSLSSRLPAEPTRAICMMRNVALQRLGRQGDEMFTYRNGAARPQAPFSIRLVDGPGRMLYLQYGVTNYCYRWCMEDGVEYGWTVEKLKLLTKCSLLEGEFAAAQKYLGILNKCAFQRDWVRRYTEYARHPQLIAQDEELNTIRHLQRHDNFLTADMRQMEHFLIEHFTTADSSDPFLQEQILVAAMQAKDTRLIWQQIYKYTDIHLDKPLPRHYQEAACLVAHLRHIDISQMPFDPLIVSSYNDFARIMGEGQQRGTPPDVLRERVYERFHTTYFYDFYFNTYNFIEQ